MVAAVTRVFGVHNLALAEDVVQEAFCRALEVWKFRGPPENPSAWLMVTAKNCALDAVRRERRARKFAPELGRLLESEWTAAPVIEELFTDNALKDDLLRMMFTCCHPRLPEEAQVAVVLNILCGFSVGEVAGAFLSTHAAIEKRIQRSKKRLAASKSLFDLATEAEVSARLPAVHRTLYLLFNEGYHGASSETVVRAELCREAMRLASILSTHPLGATPTTYALCSLMCFNAARLPGRVDASGSLVPLFNQDRSQWDSQLIAEGVAFMDQSAAGTNISEYHLEAAIACVHASAASSADTDWAAIVNLYDQLRSIRKSPVIELNRAIAVAQLKGPDKGIEEILAIADKDRLSQYLFYSAALGELQVRAERFTLALEHFRVAHGLARNPMELRFIQARIALCENTTENTQSAARGAVRHVPGT